MVASASSISPLIDLGARKPMTKRYRPAALTGLLLFSVLCFLGLSAVQPVLGCGSCGTSRFPTPGACVVNGFKVQPDAKGCCADGEGLQLLSRLLDALGNEAYEATKATLDKGNSPFGAAVLANKPGYPVVYADANQVQTLGTPTAHGEVCTINGFFQKLKDRPAVEDTIFLATHQPCSLCMSAIAFSGFRRVFFGFDFDMSINGGGQAGDVLDVKIIEQLWGSTCGRVDHTNGMYTYVPVSAMLFMPSCGNKTAEAQLLQERKRYKAIQGKYQALGRTFQENLKQKLGGGTHGLQLMGKYCVDCKPFPRPECSGVNPAVQALADGSTTTAAAAEKGHP